MNRSDLQKLARTRLQDARALLGINRWSAAYYLAGYAVECALKSCVLVRLTSAPELIFDDRRFSEKCWTHNLTQLIELAGLKAAMKETCDLDADFQTYWGIVKDWTEESRYQIRTRKEAQRLYEAISHKKHGVLPWIRSRW